MISCFILIFLYYLTFISWTCFQLLLVYVLFLNELQVLKYWRKKRVWTLLLFYIFEVEGVNILDNIKPILKLGSSPTSFREGYLFMISLGFEVNFRVVMIMLGWLFEFVWLVWLVDLIKLLSFHWVMESNNIGCCTQCLKE